MMDIKEYCWKCRNMMDIVPINKVGYIQWICAKCGTVLDEDFDLEDGYSFFGEM